MFDLALERETKLYYLSGMFMPRNVTTKAGPNMVQFAASVVSAEVDWTEAGKVGNLRRVCFLARAVVPASVNRSGLALVKLQEVLGRLVFGQCFVSEPVSQTPKMDEATMEAVKKLEAKVRASALLSTDKDRTAAIEVVRRFQFAEELPAAAGLKFIKPFQIHLYEGAQPVARRPYPMSLDEEAFALDQISKWLKNGT